MKWNERILKNLLPLLMMTVFFAVGIYEVGYKAVPKSAPPCKIMDQKETRIELSCQSLFGEVKKVVDLKVGTIQTETWLEKVE